jgi:hypothetical protein
MTTHLFKYKRKNMKGQSNRLQKIGLDGKNLNHILEVTPFLKL